MKDKWLKMYELAKDYYNTHGDLKINRKYVTSDGYKLGIWINTQRIAYKNRFISAEKRTNNFLPLSDEQVKLLEDIKMTWNSNIKKNQWMEMYELAQEYYKEHGNLLVNRNYETEDGYKLGIWINTQRQAYRNRFKDNFKKKLPPLSDEKVSMLERIGMIWEPSITDNIWNVMYEEAKKYYLEYGNLILINDKKLHIWIKEQRQAYRNRFKDNNKKSNLTDEQIKKLEDIGMIWDLNNSVSKWNICFLYAKAYYNEHGNLDIPKNYKTINGKYVINWIDEQINLLEQDLLTDEQIKLLESIGIKKIFYDWDKYYSEACIYFDVHKHLDIPKNYVTHDGLKLGLWIREQRKKYKNSLLPIEEQNEYLILSTDQIKKLEDIKMLWNGVRDKDEIWNYFYQIAKDYYLRNNMLYISDLYASIEEQRLNRWLKKQRRAYEARNIPNGFSSIEPLTDEQVKLLEDIGMEWIPNISWIKWNKCFEMAKDYYNKHGDLNIPVSYKSLFGKSISKWLKEQIKELNSNKLNSIQEKLLESIGIKKDIFGWEEYYIESVKYYNLHGNLNVPKKYVTIDGIMLGKWIHKLRRIYKNALLPEEKQDKNLVISIEQIKALESIGMVWEKKSKEEIWNEYYNKAKEYYKKNNNLNIYEYSKSSEERLLYKWLKKQKQSYLNRCIPEEFRNDKDVLTDKQVQLLKNIGMIFDNSLVIKELELIKYYINSYNDIELFTKVKK